MTGTHPNVQLINLFFQAYASNDLEFIKQILSPDIEWQIPGNHRLSGTKVGVEEVIYYFKELNFYSFKAQPIVMGVNDDYVIDCHLNWSNLEKGEILKLCRAYSGNLKTEKLAKFITSLKTNNY